MTDSSCVSTLARNEELEGLLREAAEQLASTTRMLSAVRCTAGLGKGQVERLERASSILAKIHEALGKQDE